MIVENWEEFGECVEKVFDNAPGYAVVATIMPDKSFSFSFRRVDDV